VLDPLRQLATARDLRMMRQLHTDLSAGISYKTSIEPAPKSDSISAWIQGDLQVSMVRVIETMRRVQGDRRMAAVSLAIAMYRSEHSGQWPDSLDALVPDYLPFLPNDPYSPPKHPIGYAKKQGTLPDGSDRVMLFTDPGGPNDPDLSPNPTYGWQWMWRNGKRVEMARQYRDLRRWVPTSTEDRDRRDSNESDDEGKGVDDHKNANNPRPENE
jgi:hypothetical protein